MKSISYKTKIEKSPGKGGWHFARIPDDIRAKLAKASGKNGNVPVLVTIGKTTWPSTSMSMGSQQWFVGIKTDVRIKESLSEGDTTKILIEPDRGRLKKGG